MKQLGTAMRRMFEQMMAKMKTNNGKQVVNLVEKGSRSMESPLLKSSPSRVTMDTIATVGCSTYKQCRHGHLESSKFERVDFSGWLMKL